MGSNVPWPLSFPELFSARAAATPDSSALTYLGDGETVSQRLTYRQLDLRGRKVAQWLTQNVSKHDRVMLVFPPGTDFIAAFLGCLYANVTAVPVYPPRRRGTLTALARIAADSGAQVVLGTDESTAELASAIGKGESFPAIRLQSLQKIESHSPLYNSSQWPIVNVLPTDLAFLQYTSGSTGKPKGVAVSHGNLIHNQRTIAGIFRHQTDRVVMAGWLPMYHDMGLVGNLMHPLSVGGELVFMPPLAFLQSPIRWLRMISDHGATISGGPNFAYDLCWQRTTEQERQSLDLSCWQVAFNGAEPLRYETLKTFESTFAKYGFSASAFCPCFGMAETTLIVTGSRSNEAWKSLAVDPLAMREGRIVAAEAIEQSAGDAISVQHLVSSGRPLIDDDCPGMQVRIVDPEALSESAAATVGEIWISGGSVASGYWGQAELTAETFDAMIVGDSSKTSYLRTGDLGFMHDGELFVTGRIKDLIIVNGENHYPQDIEAVVGASHVDLAPGNGVAFSTSEAGSERIYVAQEVSRGAWRSFDLHSIAAAASMALWESSQLTLDGLILVRPGGIPKTTSGKLRRRQTVEMFSRGELDVLADWQRHRDGAIIAARPTAAAQGLSSQSIAADSAQESESLTPDQATELDDLRRWLLARVAELAQVPEQTVLTDQPLALLGLNSLTAVRIAGELSEKLDRRLPPTLAFDHPTIDDICRFLVTGQSRHQAWQPTLAAVDEPVAVIGIGCRFPGADSVADFFAALSAGKCSTGRPPAGRFTDAADSKSWRRPDGGFLNRIDLFDPLFFGISPREAEEMDPQQRLVLEVCWETFEHAGVTIEQLRSRHTGVFFGVSGNEYSRAMAHDHARVTGHTATGNSQALVANRLSYLLDFRGPSLVVDTACSSSLVAVHLAIMNLMRGECDVAIAGGVSLQCSADITKALQAAAMLSPSGVSRTFASGADGFVRGEGCGAVLLKRLTDAQRDGDRIFCVLKGSAVNQDGRSNGLTAPNGPAQRDVIRQSLRRAALEPDQIDYIEAHGTGTELGDPIEVGAIAEVFSPRKSPLLLGSVKTNIGHLEGAAGIAGLIKTCLSLHHQTLPQHLHFEQPSPHIDWQPLIEVAAQSVPWPRRADRVRRAGVSSFGFGGTNAHVIVEEAPLEESNNSTPIPHNKIHWLKLSGKTPIALRNLASRYAEAIKHGVLRDANPSELAIAANVGRSDWNHRAVVSYRTTDELIAGLREIADRTGENDNTGTTEKLAESISVWPDNQPFTDEAMSRLMSSYQQGASIDWPAVMGTRRRTLSLPTYPFERQRCWYRSEDESSAGSVSQPSSRGQSPLGQSLLGSRLDLASDAIVFETDISGFVELADHRVGQKSVFPAAGYLELASAAAKSLSADSANRLSVSDLRLLRPLAWSLGQPMRVQVLVDAVTPQQYEAKVLSRQSSGWQLHATCRFTSEPFAASTQSPIQSAILESKTISPSEHYDRCDKVGLRYSGVFRCLKRLSVTQSGATGEVMLPVETDDAAYELHPALLDGCFQGIAGLMSDHNELWLPVSIGRYEILSTSFASAQPLRFSITESASPTSTIRQFDLTITTAAQTPVAKILQLVVQKTTLPKTSSPTSQANDLESQSENESQSPTYIETWVAKSRSKNLSAAPTVTASELSESIVKVRDQLAYETGYCDDRAVRGELDELALQWSINAIVEVVGTKAVGAQIIRSGLVDEAAIAPAKQPLFWRLLEMLTQSGFLVVTAEGWRVIRALATTDAAATSDRLLKHYPRLAPELRLITRCGRRLADGLRGDVDPLVLLFSDKSAGSAVDVYSQSSGAKVLNGMLAEATARLVDRMPIGRSLRVLEIGGGTAATTREIFDRVDPQRLSYTFTDIARGFLTAAEEQFGHHDDFRAMRLDIEQDCAAQALNPHSFDLIVAANVLHATADLQKTLQHVRQLLAPGGTLLLLEGVRPVRWMDITFGLTDGWWRFDKQDSDRRYALISSDQWRQRLSRHGFVDLDVLPPSSEESIDAENVLIAATADQTGVRQNTQPPRLIVANDSVVGETICKELINRGQSASVITIGDSTFAESELAVRQFVQANPDSNQLVFAGASFGAVLDPMDNEVAGSVKQRVGRLIATIRGAMEAYKTRGDSNPLESLTVLTSGVYRISSNPDLQCQEPLSTSFCGDAPLVGVTRSLLLENPDLRCRLVDIQPIDLTTSSVQSATFQSAMDELLADDVEPEVAITDSGRFVRRLEHFPLFDGGATRYALRVGNRGTIDCARLEYELRPVVGGDEIEIEVRATGLNFRDVLNLLGRYPGEIPLGAECAGVVIAVGSHVDDFEIGDRVIAIAPDCFANTVVTPAVSAVRMPDTWTFADGASISVAYLTASVALESLAQVRSGQRVLIHAAAGGVGLAAVSLCQSLGAEVFATASFAKHAYLNGLGIGEIANSRSKGFAASIRAATNGKGVDVVLNMLDESFVDENLMALAPSGRYIDITKPSGDGAKRIAASRPDVEYHCFDLAEVIRNSPLELRAQLQSLVDRIESKSLRKIATTCFPFESATKAFRELQRASGIGKIVVTQNAQPASVSSLGRTTIQSDRAYVIVGGFGDLGLLTAKSLLNRGAGLVALIGRREIDIDLQQQIDSLCPTSDRLLALRADASDRHQLAVALDQVRQRFPIGGVIHSSGILGDAMVQDQTERTIGEVFDSKATVALHLHQLTLDDHPHLFVLYSSLASVIGAPGQSNHAAANALLDSLADYRLASGLPVVCIQWGPWLEIGEAARRGATMRVDLKGVGAISPQAGAAMIDRFLTLTGVRFAASPLNITAMPSRVQEHPLFQQIRIKSQSVGGVAITTTASVEGKSPLEQENWLRTEIVATLSQVLGIDDPSQVGFETAYSELGVDSLTGIEFIDAMNRKLGIKLQTSAIYDHPSVSEMTRFVMPQIFPPVTHASATPIPAMLPTGTTTLTPSVAQTVHATEIEKPADLLPQTAPVAVVEDVEESLADLLAELNKWKS